jgi:hypothetical protein
MKVPSLLGYLIMRKVCANERFWWWILCLIFLFVRVILVSSNGNSLCATAFSGSLGSGFIDCQHLGWSTPLQLVLLWAFFWSCSGMSRSKHHLVQYQRLECSTLSNIPAGPGALVLLRLLWSFSPLTDINESQTGVSRWSDPVSLDARFSYNRHLGKLQEICKMLAKQSFLSR